MPSSSDSGVSDKIDPLVITSDDEMATDQEVYTLDTTSTDEDDFQPFALPDVGDDLPLADGLLDGDLPLVQIPTPLPLAAVPGDQDGGAPMDDDIPPADIPVDDPVVEVPDMEVPSDSSGPDSFESVSSSTFHALGLQRYPTDTDTDTVMFEAPVPQLGLGFIPDFPHDFDSDQEVEFIPEEQPAEAPILPDDRLLDIPADYELAHVDPEPVLAPGPVLAHDHLPVHDPILVDATVVAPPVVDVPVIAPSVADVPVVISPLPDPAPVFVDRAPFATQDIPPPRPGEGPSTQQHDHMPPMTAAFSFMPPFAPAAHTAFPSSAPMGEPFMWFSPNVMPLSNPYHPYHVEYNDG
ncbi:skin secretory protein xP2-like [Helianthus annuus]|uniref:skin secretory protein xP2-like n=1 Tax=Helianthus annuus TaxID=4232 RepID=UPI000B8FA823|nr:skin secretory protein xP2-like [Helianthus annuus]